MKRVLLPVLLSLFALLIFITLSTACFAAGPVKPSPQDKCPVCGMFVAKYPDFMAEIIFKDGSYAVFDGAKDMFHYYLDLHRYNPSKTPEDIESIYVTDYYCLDIIDGAKALFITGSNITGPMGKRTDSLSETGRRRAVHGRSCREIPAAI